MVEMPNIETVLEATGVAARLGRTYAEALIAAATREGHADLVGEELNGVVQAIANKPQVDAFLKSSAVHKKAKLPILGAGFESNCCDLVKKFLGVLNQNDRLDLLPTIAANYHKLRDASAGRIRVKVISAVPFDDAKKQELTSTLALKLQAQPVLDVHVQPEILGGLIVQVGDRVYDTSVRTRLETLSSHLMTSGHYGA